MGHIGGRFCSAEKARSCGLFENRERILGGGHVFPHAHEVVAQDFAFAFVEIFQRRFFGLYRDFVHAVHQRLAFFGEEDEVGAAVLRVLAAVQQSFAFEFVDLPGECHRRQIHVFGEPCLADPFVARKVGQKRPLGAGNAVDAYAAVVCPQAP